MRWSLVVNSLFVTYEFSYNALDAWCKVWEQ